MTTNYIDKYKKYCTGGSKLSSLIKVGVKVAEKAHKASINTAHKGKALLVQIKKELQTGGMNIAIPQLVGADSYNKLLASIDDLISILSITTIDQILDKGDEIKRCVNTINTIVQHIPTKKFPDKKHRSIVVTIKANSEQVNTIVNILLGDDADDDGDNDGDDDGDNDGDDDGDNDGDDDGDNTDDGDDDGDDNIVHNTHHNNTTNNAKHDTAHKAKHNNTAHRVEHNTAHHAKQNTGHHAKPNTGHHAKQNTGHHAKQNTGHHAEQNTAHHGKPNAKHALKTGGGSDNKSADNTLPLIMTTDLPITSSDKDAIDKLIISRDTSVQFAYDPATSINDITTFIATIGDNSNVDAMRATRAANAIHAIIKNVLTERAQPSGIIWLRGTVSRTNAYRWHRDGTYFTTTDKTPIYKFVTTLRGQSTPIVTDPTAIAKYNDIITTCNQIFGRIRSYERTYNKSRDDTNLIIEKLTSYVSPEIIASVGNDYVQTQPLSGVYFLIMPDGSNAATTRYGAIHSEPERETDRIFLAVLPGDRTKCEEWLNNK